MPGKLRDLSQPTTKLPGEVLVDTNLVMARFVAAALQNTSPQDAQRAVWFFNQVALGTTTAFVPPTAIEELLHKMIVAKFKGDVPNYHQAIQARFPALNPKKFHWNHLFKARPNLLRTYARDLSAVVTQMVNFGLYLVQPWELDELEGASWEDELVRCIKRYHTDVNDTHILVDARRAGISNIVTLDSDLQRLTKDFSIYTWL